MTAKSLAIIGDTVQGTCPLYHDATEGPESFTGTWGAPPTPPHGITVNGINAIMVGDIGQASCGHTFIAVEGAPGSTGPGGISMHRAGDGVGILQNSPKQIVGQTLPAQHGCTSN